MLETDGDRRQSGRRFHERRALECEEFLAARAGYCERLRMRLTPEGCMEIRNRCVPPVQCEGCPGVFMERRLHKRRAIIDRRSYQ